MKIRFKLCEFYNILDQYKLLFEDLDTEWINLSDTCCANVNKYRIVISKLNLSFRVGDMFYRNEEVDDPADEMAWEFAHSVHLIYKKNEKDTTKFDLYSTESLEVLFSDVCVRYSVEDINQLNCYIETDEFATGDLVRSLYPKNWKEAAMFQFQDLFNAFGDEEFTIAKEEKGVDVCLTAKGYNFIHMTLRPNYLWYQHCYNYTIIARTEEEFPRIYKEITDFTRNLVEKKIAIIYIFSSENDKCIGTLFVPFEEAVRLSTNEMAIQYVREKGVDLCFSIEHVCFTIDIYCWGLDSRRFKIWLSKDAKK